MEQHVTFVVPGKPQGKGRPRATVIKGTGHARMYTPEKTVSYENWIRSCYRSELDGIKFVPPIKLQVNAYFVPPKSYSKKKRGLCLDNIVQPTCKPDMDNIVKAVADALNGVAYDDDSSITELAVRKLYGPEDRLHIRISGSTQPVVEPAAAFTEAGEI